MMLKRYVQPSVDASALATSDVGKAVIGLTGIRLGHHARNPDSYPCFRYSVRICR